MTLAPANPLAPLTGQKPASLKESQSVSQSSLMLKIFNILFLNFGKVIRLDCKVTVDNNNINNNNNKQTLQNAQITENCH